MISLPILPKVIKKEGNKAVFEIEALYPGYGITVGNSMRRVLLSSLSGAAITQMKIKGASHEFATIPGILEDVILIMQNLKQLRFKLFGEEPQKAVLKVKGAREAKGEDFKLPSQVEIINKSQYIATLTSKSSELEIEVKIERGVGYSPRDQRKQEKLETGAIGLDAFFTPVRRVSFKVDNMRVGERTDYDRLFLELETDGTVSPEEAFWKASETIVSHFSLFSETAKQLISVPAPKADKAKKTNKAKKTIAPKKVKKTKNEKKSKRKKI